MDHRHATRMAFTFAACCSMQMFAGDGWTQDSQVTELENRGRTALEAKQYSTARELFSEGAANATDPGEKARLNFREAVSIQQMVDTGGVENPEEKLQQAARLYQSYLEYDPGSAAAANNLAKTYATAGFLARRAGDDQRAGRYFRRAGGHFQTAIEANDASQGLYLKNYAEFLDKTGQWEQAKTAYARLIGKFPVAPALQQSLAATYREHGLDDLAEYLWSLQDAGYIRQSAEAALDALEQTVNDNDRNRVELMTIVCAALAQATDSRDGFADSDTGRRISALAADTSVGVYAQGILTLYRGDNLQADEIARWNLGEGLSSREGFSALIRSLGSRSQRAGDLKLAESYFLLAVSRHAYSVDPIAIRDLVRMYAEFNEFDKVDRVLNEYEVRLFADKAGAYRDSDVEKIFQYHQTLGELYALIERWGDSRRVDSAIFQLEHAQSASRILSDQTGGKLPENCRFTPEMVNQLSTGYEKTGRSDKSLELRIDQAEIYRKAGDTKDAIRVLSPIQQLEIPPTLPDDYRIQLETYSRDGLIELQKVDRDKPGTKNIDKINKYKNVKDVNGR